MVELAARRWFAALVCACACSFDSGGGAGGSDVGGDGSDEGPGTDATGTTANTGATTTAAGSGEGSSGSASSDATTASDDDSDGSTGGGTPPGARCPDPLPPGWIACFDFEGAAPTAGFSSFADDDGSLAVVPLDDGHALRVRHGPDTWSGELWLRFGDGPPHDVIAQGDHRFDEVWVSMRVRTDAGWPGAAPNHLVEVAAMDSQWQALAAVELYGLDADPRLDLRAKSCVVGGMVQCGAFPNGWSLLNPFASATGNATIFDGSQADSWHCVELHARLAATATGAAELFVDDAPDATATSLDFLQGVDSSGWNLLHLDTWWGNAPARPVDSFIDGLVLSTERAGCTVQ
ncbi:MAG: hypothetical protein K1X88_27430 [Nannocystaceae bacterium]|nr:hypothetical protein [Nannocystaceae bacterium]